MKNLSAIVLLVSLAYTEAPVLAQQQNDRTTAQKSDERTLESSSLDEPSVSITPKPAEVPRGYDIGGALRQSTFFLGIEHGLRLLGEASTRRELKGPFFKDWGGSVSHMRGWGDGDPFAINYLGHPMQGAITGFIEIQNDPIGRRQVFNSGKEYWKSRSKAIAFAALYEIQFEIGPLSEASIGNVGLKPVPASGHPQSYVDFVITPTLGAVWLLSEDMIDRYLITKLEFRTGSRGRRILIRTALNPSRSFANLLRFKVPWYRDSRAHGVSW